MSKNDVNLDRVLRISRLMLHLAEEGEAGMPDVRDRVVYGVLRDAAYQLRALASSRLEDNRRGETVTEFKSPYHQKVNLEVHHHPWN